MSEGEVERGQELPTLTDKSFEKLPFEEQEILEVIAGGGPRDKNSPPGILEEKIVSEIGRTKEEKKEYQNALRSLKNKGLVKKTELGGAIFYDLRPKDRVFLEGTLEEE